MFDWIRDHAWETWLGLAILLGLAELISLELILVMLAAGALTGMLAALLGLDLVFQALAAAVAAVAMLALVRPSLMQRLHNGPELTLGHNKLVGLQGVVTAPISSLAPGRIKVSGEEWTAEPYDDTLSIAAGETVEVLQIKGATAYVHPVARLE